MFRLIRGADCYWAVGQRRIARVPLSGVDQGGQLTNSAAGHLRDADLSPAVDPDLYHMTVVITTRCNLACSYCFQNVAPVGRRGRRAPARIPGAVVNEDTTAEILDFCRRQMLRRSATKLDLMLFGGEPTLYLGRCVRLLEGAGQLGLVSASMISNATRLGPAAAVALERAGLRSVQVTLDGDAAVHDRIRITPGGRGTFEQILRNLEQAASSTSLRWLLRVNLTGESIGTADALVDRLAGRLNPSSFNICFARVNDSGVGFTDTVEPSVRLGRRVGELYIRALRAGFGVRLPALKQCLACDEVGGTTGMVVNADGTLYSCWESVGKQDYAVGTLRTGYAPEDVIRPRWVSCGYEAKSQPGTPDLDAFNDTVNAAILDWLYADGRLRRARALIPDKIAQ